MACSIKGNVKGNTSPATGRGADFLDFQPLCAGGHALCGTDLTSSLSSTAYLRCDDANRFAKLSKRSGCTVSTMVLSEALGLRLFRVIRGGIGFNTETGSRRHPAYRPSSYSPSNPSVSQNRLAIVRKGRRKGLGWSAEALKLLAVSTSQRRSFLLSSKVSG